VLAAHAGALWGLQAGWQARPPEPEPDILIAASLISEVAPAPAPTPPATPPTPQPRKAAPAPTPPQPAPTQPQPVARPATTPAPAALPATQAEPSPNTPTATPAQPSPAAPASAAVAAGIPQATPASTAPAPAPAKVELPNASASYLNNPKPPYPALSKRLGEEGKVVVRAWIDTSGTATRAEIKSSSGYDRLDQTALQTVLNWRYIPGQRAGVPEAMWFNIPLNFVLE
jgi:periplasmic protein TonB